LNVRNQVVKKQEGATSSASVNALLVLYVSKSNYIIIKFL
jgi:hypothetical protein